MQIQHNDPSSLEGKIKAEAFRLGFSLCGFTKPDPPAEYDRFEKWLTKGHHAGMAYLQTVRHRIMRQRPEQLFPGVKTIISLAWPYQLSKLIDQNSAAKALIAGYTTGVDYHLVLPAKLEQLKNFIKILLDQKINGQAFTDSAPILEREIASRAGLGWIGKNSCLISPDIGSAFLLAELFIDYALQPDQPFSHDRCGSCHRCIDACPTGCIQNDRTIDSSRCISYLTIENKGLIPEDLAPLLGKWLFGCDICQTVCPWNKTKNEAPNQSGAPSMSEEEVKNILILSEEEFTNRFKHSALFRAKRKGFQRNALVWLGNNGKSEISAFIENFVHQTTDPDLISSAIWAIKKLNPK